MIDKRSITSAGNGAKSNGRPRLTGDAIRKSIALTIGREQWERFEQKCVAEKLPQAEMLRQLIAGWVD